MLGPALGQDRGDPALSQPTAVSLAVIAAVAVELIGAAARAAPLAAHGRDRLDQGTQLSRVMAVGAGEERGQGYALSVSDDMVL